MRLLHIFLIDTSLLCVLLLCTVIISLIIANLWQGILDIHSLTFSLFISDPWIVFPISLAVIVPISSLTVISCFGSEMAYLLNDRFTILDIAIICTCFFAFMFLWTADIQMSFKKYKLFAKSGKIDSYYQFSWDGLEKALTPTMLLTAFVILGMFITYSHYN